uniref:Uncharacterized protein n=1 Tax=Parascaris equorum TaxID=6256 RepID=A0A914RBX8_PAREQ
MTIFNYNFQQGLFYKHHRTHSSAAQMSLAPWLGHFQSTSRGAVANIGASLTCSSPRDHFEFAALSFGAFAWHGNCPTTSTVRGRTIDN